MRDGKYFSKKFGCDVYLFVQKYGFPYDVCECCGKPLKTVYSITPESDGLEYLYGAECVKSLGLRKVG